MPFFFLSFREEAGDVDRRHEFMESCQRIDWPKKGSMS